MWLIVTGALAIPLAAAVFFLFDRCLFGRDAVPDQPENLTSLNLSRR